MLDTLDLEAYTPHVGTPFQVAAGPQRLQLVAAVADPRARRADGGRAGFSLTFRGDAATALPQGLHALSHPVLGTGSLFLVPLGPRPDGMHYEAIFN